jgi:hypothetical protein
MLSEEKKIRCYKRKLIKIMYRKHYVHKTLFFMYLNDAQRDLIRSARTGVTVFTSLTNTKEHHVLWDTAHKYKVAPKNVSGNSTEN